jgi:protein required for attachment to host cells
MDLPQNAVVAVADGKKLSLFKNEGQASSIQLKALPEPDIDDSKIPSGGRHSSSSANPGDGQQDEDGFTAGVISAAPRTLGELRKGYHKALSDVIVGELDKDLTGHSIHDIEKAIAAA